MMDFSGPGRSRHASSRSFRRQGDGKAREAAVRALLSLCPPERLRGGVAPSPGRGEGWGEGALRLRSGGRS